MEIVFYITAKTIAVFLGAISFLMLARVLLQLFVNPEESRIFMVSVMLTEPFVLPVRLLFEKLNIGLNTPFDIPFTVTYILFMVITAFLPMI